MDLIVLWFQVDQTQKFAKFQIIRTKKITKTSHIKYNGKMYYGEVPEISKLS